MINEKIRVVAATRLSQKQFFDSSPLGRSLQLSKPMYPQLQLRLFPDNSQGLPTVYNTAIQEAASDPAILVFVHDDVYFCDFFWPLRVLDGLREFDIIGIAGNRRRLPRQSAWNTVDAKGTWDDRQHLSGVLAHGSANPPNQLWLFGAPCQAVKLLDGLLLAIRSDALITNNVQFDPRFKFHFYDMDFCRQADRQGLRMGTWAISLIHHSLGNALSPEWQSAYVDYLEKWVD